MYFSATALVALTSLLSAATAQTYYPINTDDIDAGTKATWCTNQISSCGLLCLDQSSGGAQVNTCDSDTLEFQCICADNTVPNATEYSQTIPYFLCAYQVEDCANNCGQYDPTCAENCKTGKVCGATNPTRVTTTAKSSTATKTASGSQSTGSGNGDDVAYDATATDSSGASQTGASDDDPAATGASDSSNAGNRLSSVSGGTFSVMILSFLCGSFVFML